MRKRSPKEVSKFRVVITLENCAVAEDAVTVNNQLIQKHLQANLLPLA